MATTTHIKFGDGLDVTDEGAGVIRVDGSGGPQGATGPAGAPGAAGPPGPNLIDGSTPTPLSGLLKGNGTDVDVAVAGTDYATPTQLSAKVDRDAVEIATARLVAVKLATADAQPAFRILGDGRQEWGPGGASAPDTRVYRVAAGALKTDGAFNAGGNMVARQGTAPQVLFGDLGDGRPSIAFGSGGSPSLRATPTDDLGFFGSKLYIGSALDTAIYRGGAGLVKTDGNVSAAKLSARMGGDLTVTANQVTVTNGVHRILANTGSADLTTINGGTDGDILYLINFAAPFNIGSATVGNIRPAAVVFAANQTRQLVFNAQNTIWMLVG